MKNLSRFFILASVLIAPRLEAQDLRFGGFLSHGYLKSSHYNYLADSAEGDADFAEIGLNASWTPIERTTVNGQLFAFELGDYGNYEPLLDYLFVDYNLRKEFGVRAGRIKREFGVYTHIQDIDAARASILLPIGIYDQRYRDFSAALDGISFYGAVEAPKDSLFEYNLFAGSVDLKKENGVGAYAATELSRSTNDPVIQSIDSDENFGGQFWYHTPLPGLRIGVAAQLYTGIQVEADSTVPATGPLAFLGTLPIHSSFTDITFRYRQLSLEYYVADWTFVSEYLDTKANFTGETTILGLLNSSESFVVNGTAWYLSAARRLGRFEGSVTYADFVNPGVGTVNPSNTFNTDLQFSLRFDATERWSLKVESHSLRGTNRLFNQAGQNPVIDQVAWTLWAAKSTFSF